MIDDFGIKYSFERLPDGRTTRHLEIRWTVFALLFLAIIAIALAR